MLISNQLASHLAHSPFNIDNKTLNTYELIENPKIKCGELY